MGWPPLSLRLFRSVSEEGSLLQQDFPKAPVWKGIGRASFTGGMLAGDFQKPLDTGHGSWKTHVSGNHGDIPRSIDSISASTTEETKLTLNGRVAIVGK